MEALRIGDVKEMIQTCGLIVSEAIKAKADQMQWTDRKFNGPNIKENARSQIEFNKKNIENGCLNSIEELLSEVLKKINTIA